MLNYPRKNHYIAIIFLITSNIIFGQYLGYSPIEDTNVEKWVPKFEMEYYGVYRFGDSEGESTLILFSTGLDIIAQVRYGKWNSNIEATEWISMYLNLTNITIEKDGRFFSDQYNGEFMSYKDQGERIECLKIFDSWSDITSEKGTYELGPKLDGRPSDFFSGHYKNASIMELNPKDLEKMSATDLQLMRNEIFARYGYEFIQGGKMDTYFRKQGWYRPQHKNVDAFLTSLEKRNIALIQKVEKKL